MAMQVMDTETVISELGTRLVGAMAERRQTLTDTHRQTGLSFDALRGAQKLGARLHKRTAEKLAEYLGCTADEVLEATKRRGNGALVTQNGVHYPSKPVKPPMTRNCRACRDRARCRAVVSAGGLALCEELLDVDSFDLPPSRRFPIEDVMADWMDDEPADDGEEALPEPQREPRVATGKTARPVIPSLGLSLALLEIMIGKAQSQETEKGLREWLAAAQAWMPMVRQAAEGVRVGCLPDANEESRAGEQRPVEAGEATNGFSS